MRYEARRIDRISPLLIGLGQKASSARRNSSSIDTSSPKVASKDPLAEAILSSVDRKNDFIDPLLTNSTLNRDPFTSQSFFPFT